MKQKQSSSTTDASANANGSGLHPGFPLTTVVSPSITKG